MPDLCLTIGDAYLPLDPLAGSRRADPFVLVEGPRGTAKTRSILTLLMLYALHHAGARILLTRSTRTRLSQSVLVTFEEQVWRLFPNLPPLPAAGRENRYEYKLPNGSVFIPIGLDDPQRAQSVECAKIYVAEGVEIDTQEQVLALAGALRQQGMPDRQCIVDCNPGPPGHWLNKIAEPVAKSLRRVRSIDDYRRVLAHNAAPARRGVWKRMLTSHMDNPGYFDPAAWRWTESGEQYLATLGELRGHLRRRWLDGEWVAAEGVVYPEFDADRHIVDPYPIPRSWPVYVAKDPGRDHPDATLFCAVAPTGQLIFCAESVVRQTTVEQDGQVLRQMCSQFNVVRKLGDPHYMFSVTKMSDTGRTIAEQMRDYGHVFEPAPAARSQAEIAQQVDMVRTLLASVGPDGRPMLQVFRSCPSTINGYQSWGYQRDTKGQIKGGEDKFSDVGDDEMDCVRMIVATRPRFEPQREIVRVPAPQRWRRQVEHDAEETDDDDNDDALREIRRRRRPG